MRCSQSIAFAALVAYASAHGLVLAVKGANTVEMPGLSVIDGTPRDCITPACGSEADTSIIRDREIASGKASPLGRTQGGGPVKAETMVSNFMGAAAKNKRKESNWVVRQLGALLGGGNNAGTKADLPAESSVASSSGAGADSGLPTCSDSGEISMTYRQINQDGAGPLTAAVDGTSGGTEASAFQDAEVTQDVPGIGVGGLSLASKTDFPLKVQMPAGMTCDGTVAGVSGVCIVRVRNSAAAGPFGGSAAFTMSPAARKRAIAYRMKKRQEIVRS